MNVNVQSKKNLRYRAKKIFDEMRKRSPYPLAMEYTGSFAKKGPIKMRGDGSYDLDIDIKSKFINAKTKKIDEPDVIMREMHTIINKVIRKNEEKINKERVIFIGNDTDGFKYNLDIAFKLIKDGKVTKTIIKGTNGKYTWK